MPQACAAALVRPGSGLGDDVRDEQCCHHVAPSPKLPSEAAAKPGPPAARLAAQKGPPAQVGDAFLLQPYL